ncbi:resolvase [Vibrio vulnificus]|uniref:recombinase family protein n=1 Tax=Vibrio vulnificus TaxID=672 RepID=UPI00405A3E5A
MNYLYRRLAYNELDHYNRDGFTAVFMDVADFESGAAPRLREMMDVLSEGDVIHFSTMADLGTDADKILNTFHLLVKKKVSVCFLKENINIEQFEMEGCYRYLSSFHDADLVNKIGEREYHERRRVEKAKVAAKLSGERLNKALAITREYVNGDANPQDLSIKYAVGLTTVYRYIRDYKSEVLKEN